MRRTVPALLLVVSLIFAGCVGSLGATDPVTDQPSATTPDSPTDAPTVSADYLVRAGEFPDEFASVTATVRVVFVRNATDLGPCYPELFSGPYKPTITPLPTPTGGCYSETVEVDLTDAGERTVSFEHEGPVRGHALILTDLTATLENGTRERKIKGIGGVELLRERGAPAGRYGVEVGIVAVDDDRPYDYYVDGERFDLDE